MVHSNSREEARDLMHIYHCLDWSRNTTEQVKVEWCMADTVFIYLYNIQLLDCPIIPSASTYSISWPTQVFPYSSWEAWITQISPYITSHSICIWWTCVYWATVSISDPPDLHIPHRPCIMCSPIIIAGNMSDHLVIWYIYSTHIYRQSVLSPWAPTHFLACLELYVHIYHHLSLLFTSLHL